MKDFNEDSIISPRIWTMKEKKKKFNKNATSPPKIIELQIGQKNALLYIRVF